MRLVRWFAVLAVLAVLAALVGNVSASVRRVPLQYATITAALAAATSGDTVLVSGGTYSPSTNGETFPLQMTTGAIRLLGAGMDATVLDAANTASVIRHDAAIGGRIDGFRITGGNGSQGGGVDIVHGAVEIAHNRFDHNGASIGGAGISARNDSAPWIHHNVLVDNFATTSNDVHAVRLNQTVSGIFEHNLVAHTDGNGLLTVESAGSVVRDNIFYRNGIPTPLRGRGICWLSNAPATIHHNLFFQNQVAALLWMGGGGDFSGTAANSFDAMDGVYGNLDGDPQFVDPVAGDYHLLSASPAIDAGDPTHPVDSDGTVADIGPYAYTHVLSAPPRVEVALAPTVSPNPSPGATELRFSLSERAFVRVDIVDLSGRLVQRLVEGPREAGSQVLHWNGSDRVGQPMRSGVYFAIVRAGDVVRVTRWVVAR